MFVSKRELLSRAMRARAWVPLVLAIQVFANLQQIDLFHYHLKIFKDAFDETQPDTFEDLLTLTMSSKTKDIDDAEASGRAQLDLMKWATPLSSNTNSIFTDLVQQKKDSSDGTTDPKKVKYKEESVVNSSNRIKKSSSLEEELSDTNFDVQLDEDLDDEQTIVDKPDDNLKSIDNESPVNEKINKEHNFNDVAVEPPRFLKIDSAYEDDRSTPAPTKVPSKRGSRQSHHKGLREVSAMNPGYYKAPLKLVHTNQNNEYRDPESSDSRKMASPETQELGDDKNKSSKLELIDRLSDLELSEKGQSQDPSLVQLVDEPEPAPATPVAAGVDYVTNYIEDDGFIHPPTYDLPKKTKKAKWVYMEGIANANEYLNTNSKFKKTKQGVKGSMKEMSYGGESLESVIESDPSLRRKTGETTTAYFERIYPRIKNIMERENKQTKESIKSRFIKYILRGFKKGKNLSANNDRSRSLLFKSVFNMTIFKGCFEPTESTASLPMESFSSIIGAVVVIIILSV